MGEAPSHRNSGVTAEAFETFVAPAADERLRAAVRAGIEAGLFRPVSPELVAHNLKMAAHAWALKHWDLARHLTLADYIDAELDLVLTSIRV